MKVKYQLWVLYEVKGEWRMEGFYDSEAEANEAYRKLWDDPETPCIGNSETVRVEVMR